MSSVSAADCKVVRSSHGIAPQPTRQEASTEVYGITWGAVSYSVVCFAVAVPLASCERLMCGSSCAQCCCPEIVYRAGKIEVTNGWSMRNLFPLDEYVEHKNDVMGLDPWHLRDTGISGPRILQALGLAGA
jgi:hypothetical protein